MNDIDTVSRAWPSERLSLQATGRARTIVERLGGVWRGSHGVCRCPAHDDRSPSLSVRLGNSAILFHCFAGCTTTAVLSALRALRLHDSARLALPTPLPRRDLGPIARRLWAASRSIDGTLAERYLLARGLLPPFPKSLRFHAHTVLGSGPGKRVMPAMIAAIQNDLGLVAVQRTFLDPRDVIRKPIAKPKASLGLLGSAAIRLGVPTDELGLAEGIEDALSVMAWFGTPTWALGGVERLVHVEIPASVRRIIVYADRGRAASRLFVKARQHLIGPGRELIRRLPPLHDDWNDAWQAERSQPLQPERDPMHPDTSCDAPADASAWPIWRP